MRRRTRPDGLPFQLYERVGKTTYSIGYKSPDNSWTFRLKCDVQDAAAIKGTRAEAIHRAVSSAMPSPAENSFAALSAAFFEWQSALPLGDEGRRAESTLTENRREAGNLDKAFGRIDARHLEGYHAYQYLAECQKAGRGAKANKEISLARSILEYGVRVGKLKLNLFTGVKKLTTFPSTRLVTDAELLFVLKVGRSCGGVRLIAALALYTAYLCVRRSGEVLSLTRAQLRDDGIHWTAAKRKRGTAALVGRIEWSPTLRAIIDEALEIPRNVGASSEFVFGNLAGRRYTKGGWKKTLWCLMDDCAKVAAHEDRPFTAFSLQDCRPAGVTERLENKDPTVMDATLHTSERMLRSHYDRRRIRVARATK